MIGGEESGKGGAKVKWDHGVKAVRLFRKGFNFSMRHCVRLGTRSW